jgi:iron complex outermembrane receptor protein
LIVYRSIPTFFALAFAASVSAQQASTDALKKLSLDELMNLEVTSASKTTEPLSDAPAAIFVITRDEILRSGATSIPEMLRLAPNLQVMQLSASNYTITARGFSGNSSAQNFSNKLLVLIDGRSVYTPLYSGVYWDAQEVVADDIDRIEVISGPGATLWGANAVNGVINIITRQSADTQGGLVTATAGNLERQGTAQFGGALADAATYRVYAKGFERSALDTPSGPSANDAWSKVQGGFRSDWHLATDSITVQGDLYRANEEQAGTADLSVVGANVLTRWQHAFANGSALQMQAYYDETQRFNGAGGGAFVLNTYDLEIQHSIRLAESHDVVWGAGRRASRYNITNATTLQFIPPSRTLTLSNVFAQDSISLAPKLKLILGIKLEDDPYTGTTPLPNVRLSWKLNDAALLWSAASRAIRSATPFDRDVAEYLAGQLFLIGGPDFAPERLTAYEIGYRGRAGPRVTFSVSTFYNVYDDLRSIEFEPTGLILPLRWGNGMKGETSGLELWGDIQLADWWRLSAGFSVLHEHLTFKPGSSALLGIEQAGDDPPNQASLRSSMNLTTEVTLDFSLRHVGSLPNPAVPHYEELNTRLGWQVSGAWEVALSGFNLLHAHHNEFTVPPSEDIGRSGVLEARWHF